ncbi:MAG: hypothetical protein WC610_00980 [Patescibacteria group bacterium]
MKHFLTKILLVLLLGLILPQLVFAADLFFEAKTSGVGVGEQFEVKLLINTPEESVNALEGKIIFPSNLVGVKEIRDGNSLINFWIDRPKAQNDTVTFSGITPGGFQGNNGLLFSAVLEAKSEGIAHFEVSDAKVLRNDGMGSSAALTTAPLEITISLEALAVTPIVTKVKDTESPESFMPEIAKDESTFGGKWFVVFATQDKGSGIDHYEIRESRQKFFDIFQRWSQKESPYILQDQELRSYIFVKAVDKAGNTRVEQISPRNPLRWYENYENWLIIILGFAITYAIKILWRKYLKM